MMAYRKKGFPGLYMRVPVRSGADGPVRSLGTTDDAIAEEIEALVKRLAKYRRWDLLELVTCTPPKTTLAKLYDADRSNRLDELLEIAADVDLTEHLDGWERWANSNLGGTGTAAMYRMQVSTLIADPTRDQPKLDREAGHKRIVYASELTAAAVSRWLATRLKKNGEPITTGYKLKLFYALSSLVQYLREIDKLSTSELDNVKRPKRGKPRVRWETEENDVRIVKAIIGSDRQSIAAFIKATGAEVSAALAMVPRDVELWPKDDAVYCGIAHVPGTKTETRDRHDVLIEKWARPFLGRQLKGLTPNAVIWGDLNRHQAHHAHESACVAVEVKDYTLRDARHSWAVRARKRGVSYESIAEQLGNTPWQVANTYTQFKPTMAERIADGQKTDEKSTNPATSDLPDESATVTPIRVKR